jgi:hypothetical protein
MSIKEEVQTVFKATDGKTFTDRDMASRYQAALDYAGLIDQYVKSNPERFGAQGAEGRTRTVLTEFLPWLSEQPGVQIPVIEAPKAEAA